MSAVSPIALDSVAELSIAPRYVSPRQAAVYSGIAAYTLEKYRRNGQGPAYIAVGRRVLYDLAVLDAFLAARSVQNTAQAAALRAQGGAL